MMGRITKVSFLLVLLMIPFVSASYISMQITVNTYGTNSIINVTNKGDESAHNVQLVSKISNIEYESEIISQLRPEESHLTTLTVNFSDKLPGNYPALTKVHYEDANGYPFSALVASIVKNKEPARSGISLDLEDVEISDKLTIKVTAKNLEDTLKDAQIYLFVSDEFVTNTNANEVQLEPKQSKDIFFEVENFGAKLASTYSFYAVGEYEEKGLHRGTLAPSTIKVLAKRTLFNTKNIITTLILLVIIIIILQFRRKK